MKQSIDPDKLYDFDQEIISTIPQLLTRTIIVSVKYPSNMGFVTLTAEEVNTFWKGYLIVDIVKPAERYEKMDSMDIERRRFVYVLVVKMHQQSLKRDR